MTKALMSLEIPSTHLWEISPLVDLHFVIASEILKNNVYFTFYKNYLTLPPNQRKIVILDNGMYEEGKPLKPKELLEIALDLRPDIVFAPDQHPNREETFELTKEFLSLCKENHIFSSIGLIPQGSSPEEVVQNLKELEALISSYPVIRGPIGLSFLNDRTSVLKIMEEKDLFKKNVWYHMLGLYGLTDIQTWPRLITKLSYDTVKPIKAAYHGYNVEACPRGLGKWNSSMIVGNKELLFRNIAKMHEASTL